MDSSKTYMHPSVLLVNDEILSTRLRLMELYVKQAEAMAAAEAARAQEHFQAELTTLKEELKQKEIALEPNRRFSSSRLRPRSRDSKSCEPAASGPVFAASSAGNSDR
jgi:hypothetical protein